MIRTQTLFSMAFWAAPIMVKPPVLPTSTISVMPEEIEEIGLGNRVMRANASKPITDEQRRTAIAQARAHHNGTFTFDVRLVLVVGLVAVVGVVLWIFFRNMRRARLLIAEQLLARRSAQVVATQLELVLPQRTGGSALTPATAKSGTLPPPTLTKVSAATSTMLQQVQHLQKLVDDDRVSLWVLDSAGWVYADSKKPQHGLNAQGVPHYNLFTLQTVDGSSVAAVILETANHGAGLVRYTVPSLGTSSAAIVHVEQFVQPVNGTEFFVSVQVGSKSSGKGKA